ncbi:hypothetical protein V9J80_003590 [Vibrio cholerae]|nr:hypothetical protein [Vibrio cholerae]EJL6920389.1 hypothetical protein [Vibrio cholerae]EJR3604721.1 hypothetical protein [Vibrio cholerae]EKF9128975.1 hypothetical protein [Vibrio cholerae]EKF9168864.1 hypothetical protein [Vibrio cholerae]
MSIIQEYKLPKDMLEKLAREGERTWKCRNIQDKADHFFNFCVTSLSLRDWCIAYLELEGKEESQFYDMHSKNKWLNYCGSIANASKHFKLIEGRKSAVKSVDSKISKLVALGVNGQVIEGMESERVSFDIQVSDTEVEDLMVVLFYCVVQWEEVFKNYNIPAPSFDIKARMLIEYVYP